MNKVALRDAIFHIKGDNFEVLKLIQIAYYC